ncbi:MAG: hypothetical protein J6D00_08590 [Christensenellaceae bacterium]|nr:hypothetical protein [Christensenellaceae bacterium]
MAERYSRLYSLPKNLYTEGAPIIVSAGTLLKDKQTGQVLVQLKFQNITSGIIKALKVSIDAFDVSGIKLESVDEYQYLDLAAKRDDYFGSKTAFPLPENVTRSYTVTIKSVVFENGSVWHNTVSEMCSLADQRKTDETLGELSEQYKRDTGITTNSLITEDRDLWLCRCAAINRNNEEVCHKCGIEKSKLLDALNIELLKQHKAAFEEEQSALKEAKRIEKERKAEEERIRIAANKKKAKKIAAIILPSIAAIAAIVILTVMVFIPNSKYNNAVALMNAGEYEEAITAFTEIIDHKDSTEQIKNCEIGILDDKYDAAIVLMNEGQYEEAITAFTEIIDHRDSTEQIKNCEIGILDDKYGIAAKLFNDGSYIEAYNGFIEISDYKDSIDHAYMAAGLIADDYLNKNDIKNAAVWYDNANNQEKSNEIMYTYVLEHYDNTNPTTYSFLKLLKQRNHKNAAELYDSLYAIKVELVVNQDYKSTEGNVTHVTDSRHNGADLYAHFRVVGGTPNQTFTLKVITDCKLGSAYTNTLNKNAYGESYWVHEDYKTVSIKANEWQFAFMEDGSNVMQSRIRIIDSATQKVLAEKVVYIKHYGY